MSEGTLAATEYIRRGSMLVLRAALPEKDPESWPSLWRDKFGEEMPSDKRREVGCAPKRCETCRREL